MLTLNRKEGESIIINGNIKIVVHDIRGKQVKLSIDAPKEISVNREELENKIKQGK